MPNIIPLPSPTFNGQTQQTGQNGYNLAGGIDALFNAYQLSQRAQLQRAQIGQMDIQNQGSLIANQGAQQALDAGQANFRLQNQGLTPQDVNQFLPQATQPQASQSLYGATPGQAQAAMPGAPMQAGQPMPLGPQPQQGLVPEDPKVAVLRNILSMHMQGQQFGMQEAGANLAKTRAEAEKASQEGRKVGIFNDLMSGSGGAGNLVGTLTDQAQAGNVDPALPDMGRGEDQSALRLAVGANLANRGVNGVSLRNAADASNKGATAQAEKQMGMGQVVGTAAGTLEDVLNKVQPMVSQLNKSQLSILNDAWSKGLRQVNDPKAQAVLVYLNEAKGLYASVIGNGAATDPDKQSASESISHGLNKEGFGAMKDAILFTAQSKMKRLQGKGYNEPGPKSGGPKAGDVEDGYKFKGGDASKPTNWVKQ